MTILDPITQAAIALQGRNAGQIPITANTTIPVSFGHRRVKGFPIWVSQRTAPAVSSTIEGVLTSNGTANVSNGDTVTIGGEIYTFQSTLTNVARNVKIGATAADSLTNLFHAINASGGVSGTDYAAATVANGSGVATSAINLSVTVSAKSSVTGTISTTATSATLSWAHTTMTSTTVAGQPVQQLQAPPILAGATRATFAVSLGYSVLPPEQRAGTKIMRIYADGQLVFDVSNPAAAPDFNGMSVTFHPGLAAELPDATIAADMGQLTPAFRNLLYVVLRDFPLQVGPTPVAPPPVTTAPTTVKTTKVYPFPGWGGTGVNLFTDYPAGLVNIGVGGLSQFRLHSPSNPAYPEGGFGGIYFSWVNDSQSRTGHGGAYNSINGTVQPYPVDIGNGQQVIAGNESGDVTIETSTVVPGVTTQAPAPAPTYRTTLPQITVELSDVVPIIPAVHLYDLIDANAPPSPLGVMVDWNTNIAYAWTQFLADPNSFLMHAYSITDRLELQRFAPVAGYTIAKDSPEATNVVGAAVNFDYLAAHDKVNGFAFTTEFHGGQGNSDPLIMISLASGQIVGAYGRSSTNVFDIDEVSVGERGCGDCVISTSAQGTAYGLVSGARLVPTVGLTRYTTGGHMTSGGHILLEPSVFSGSNHVNTVLAYPIIGRADLKAKYGLAPQARQDWFAFAGVGNSLYLVHGDGEKCIDSTLVYTTPYGIQWSFIDPTDNNVVMVEVDSTGGLHLEKLSIKTKLTNAGVTPTVGNAVYSVPIPDFGSSFAELSLRESRYLGGRLVYPGSEAGTAYWHTIDLGSGAQIARVQATTITGQNANTYIFDGVAGNAVVIGTGSAGAAAVNLSAGGTAGGAPLSSLLNWLMLAAGYTGSQVQIDASVNDVVEGGLISQPVGLWTYLRNLSTIFNFSYFESEGKIKFARGTSGDTAQAAYTLDLDALATSDSSQTGLNENIITTLAEPTALASGVTVTYIDAEFDFQNNAQTFQRARFPFKDFKSSTTASYDTYIVMKGGEALQRAARVAFSNYAEGVVQAIRLPFAYGRVEPGDALNLIINHAAYLVNVTEVVFNTDWSLSVTGVDFNYRNDVVVNADKPLGLTQQSTGPSDSLPLFIDSTLPAVSDNPGQDQALVFTGVQSRGQSWWTGAAFNIMEGSAAAWTQLYFTQSQAPYGLVTAALPATDAPFQSDKTHSLNVVTQTMIGSGTSSISDALLWVGTNAAFVGNVGRWELIYYKTITWTSPRRFNVTNLLRGRRGTEVHCNDHAAGDYFIPFNRSVLQTYGINPARLDEVISVAAVGQGTLTPATIVNTTLKANSLKPWAPVHVKAVLV